jgi:hypothetical protein
MPAVLGSAIHKDIIRDNTIQASNGDTPLSFGTTNHAVDTNIKSGYTGIGKEQNIMIEWFAKKTPRLGTPVMSFSKIGQIFFNQTASRVLQKEPIEYILLGWDSTEHKMVLKSIANKKDPRAYHVRYNAKGNGASFSAKTFLDHAGIDYSERKPIQIEIKLEADNFLEVKIPATMLKKNGQPTHAQVVEKG